MSSPKIIFQAITDKLINVMDERWQEVNVEFSIGENRSKVIATYLLEIDGQLEEHSLMHIEELDNDLRKLQSIIAREKDDRFTVCKFNLTYQGAFEVDYCYDAVDWNAQAKWNFTQAKTKYCPPIY